MVFPGFSFLVFWIVVGSCRLVLVGGLLILVGLFADVPVGCFGLLGCCCGVLACVYCWCGFWWFCYDLVIYAGVNFVARR